MNNSSTEVFYHLLDLTEQEQKLYLGELKRTQPIIFEQVDKLLQAERQADHGVTKILSKSASDVFDDVCFAGLLLDKYQIIEQIGKGGMGLVYSAKRIDDTYQQELAIKFIQPNLTQVLGRQAIYQEAQLLALLNHPYIAKVFDAGEHQDSVYMVMEKISGNPLKHYLESNSVLINERLRLFDKICDAIEHAHQNQVLHGDIKPENILVDERGEPKVFDFNITQRQLPATSSRSPVKAYSKAFASPEQERGEYLTQQSDLFSLGKLLQSMLPADVDKPELKLIINKAIQALPENRYVHLAELRHDIRNYLELRPLTVKKRSWHYLMKKLIQRRPVASSLLFGLAISVLSFTMVLLDKNQQLTTEQALTEAMLLELTDLVFHGKNVSHPSQFESMLEITRRKVLANQDLPNDLKQKMLFSIITPVPKKNVIEAQQEKQK